MGIEMSHQISFYEQKALNAEQRFNSLVQESDELKRKIVLLSNVERRIP